MRRPKRRQVSASMLRAAQKYADTILANAAVAEIWNDLTTTSTLSDNRGGVIRLETNYDWIVAFLMFHAGGGQFIPLER